MISMYSTLRQDVRLAFLQCARRPAFVLGATLSLAIGMALATALFSILDAALRPLPFPRSDELVQVVETIPHFGLTAEAPDFLQEVRAASATLRDVVVYSFTYPTVSHGGEPRRMNVARTTPNLFTVL